MNRRGPTKEQLTKPALRVRLRKIESTHDRVRTDVIEGDLVNDLQEGASCMIMGEALTPTIRDEGGVRWFESTPIQSLVREGNVFRFTTLNSKYELEILSPWGNA